MRTTCFLSLPPLTSNQPSNVSLIPAKPPLSSAKKESCWKRQCVVMAIIGLEMCNSVALAHEPIQITTIPIANNISNTNSKWSQKRTCPPWQGNSLETIVPENLPRPSARRRYETVRSSSKTAPSLSPPIILQTNNSTCFFM